MAEFDDLFRRNGGRKPDPSNPQKVVSAEAFELKNSEGKVMADLFLTDEGEPIFRLFSATNEQARIAITFVNGEPWLQMTNGHSQALTFVSGKGAVNCISSEKGDVLTLKVDEKGTSIGSAGPGGKSRVY